MRKMLLPVLVLLASGSIQEDAPVKTYLQIEINAPPAKVITKESMDGPWMAKIYPSEELTEANRNWLAALKQAAEADKNSN